jgi:hypothetical protein
MMMLGYSLEMYDLATLLDLFELTKKEEYRN